MAVKTKAVVEAENKKLQEENNGLSDKVSKMEEMMAKMEAMMTKIESQPQKTNENTQSIEVDETIDIIPPNKYIRVTSLCQGALYLTSEQFGGGTVVPFYQFGQTTNITFATLEKIVGANREMAEKGRYYIQDEKAIRLLMLEDVYENILDVEAIEAIVNNEKSNVLDVFKSAPKSQREHVVSMIIKKVLDGGHIDYNQLNEISKIYGKNIITKIEDAKANKDNE